MTEFSHVLVRPAAIGNGWYCEVIDFEGKIGRGPELDQLQFKHDCFESAKLGSSFLCTLHQIPRRIQHVTEVSVKFKRFGYNFMHLTNQQYLIWPYINGSPVAEFRDSYWYVNGKQLETAPTYFAELPRGPT